MYREKCSHCEKYADFVHMCGDCCDPVCEACAYTWNIDYDYIDSRYVDRCKILCNRCHTSDVAEGISK